MDRRGDMLWRQLSRGREVALTCHHLRPVCHGKLVSKPALTILPLIPAPSKRPNTVRRNKETTSWSRGESRSVGGVCRCCQSAARPNCPELDRVYIRKQRASTSPSLPVAVSGSVSPREAPAQMGRFWFRHHCFVQERHGLEGLSGMSRRRIEDFVPKHMPVIRFELL
jgi:hypothetical protein